MTCVTLSTLWCFTNCKVGLCSLLFLLLSALEEPPVLAFFATGHGAEHLPVDAEKYVALVHLNVFRLQR